MRSRKPLLTVAISLLITALLVSGAWCASKQDILARLRKSTTSPATLTKDITSFKQNSRNEINQLALDLIAYRWLWPQFRFPPHIAPRKPVDIDNLDAIITALAGSLDDPTIKWASEYFQISAARRAPAPPRGDKRAEDMSKLRDYVESARTSSPADAVKALTLAWQICDDVSLGLEITKGLLLKETADYCHYAMSNYSDAEYCYDKSAGTFNEYNCSVAYAVTCEDWAELDKQLFHFTKAATRYEDAAKRWRDLSKQHPNKYEYLDLAGRAYINAGRAWMPTREKSNNPMETMRTGLEHLSSWTYAQGKPNKTYDTLIRSRLEVAAYLWEYLENDEAKKQLKLADELCVKQEQPVQAEFSGELVKLYKAMGMDQKAEEWQRKYEKWLRDDVSAADDAVKSLAASDTLSRSRQIALCETLERGARAQRGLGNREAAVAMWTKAADHYERLGRDEQIRALRELAIDLDRLEKTQESLDVRFKAAIAADNAGRHLEAAAIAQEMASTYKTLGDLNNALEAFKELARLNEKANDYRGVAKVLDDRGQLLFMNGKYEDAARDFAEARKTYIDQVGNMWAAGEVAIWLAETHDKMGEAEMACEKLESSLRMIEDHYRAENLSSGVNDQRSIVVKTLYSALATMYVRTKQKEKASSLILKDAWPYTWRPDVVKKMAQSADPDIAAFAKALPLTNMETVEIGVYGESAVRAKNWDEFWQPCWRLQQNHRSNYDALPVDPLNIYENRSRLPKDTTVILYMVTETSLYTFVCANDKATIVETRRQRSELDEPMGQLRRAIKECEGNVSLSIPVQQIVTWQESVFLDVKEPLQKLYALLLKHVSDSFSGKKRLMFVLPEQLAGVPMHALISSNEETIPRFLIEDYEIGYLGKRMLDRLVSKDDILDSGTAKLVIFADPAGNLRGAQQEVKKILANYPNNSRAYQNNSATETSFLRECQTAGVVHIAAHYKINPDSTRFEMQLAGDANADGIVEIGELSAIQAPQLGLVVLSACDSISSSDPTSTGPSRAVEAFSLIGAKSVMGGLWKVSDEASVKIMDVFYSNIAKGHVSRAESLRRAQLDMIKNPKFAHPFYWACFALYGNPR